MAFHSRQRARGQRQVSESPTEDFRSSPGQVDTSAPERLVDSGPWRALPVLLAAATLVVMAGAVISPVLTLIQDEFGLSPGRAGLIITTHSLLIAATAPLVGALIDRMGTKRVLLAGLAAYGVFGGAGALATSYPLLLASRVLFGVAAAGVMNGLTVSLLNLWQGRARDTVMGYQATAISAGGVLWPIIGGILGGIGWREPFAVYLIALPIAVAAVWLVPDSRPGSRPASTGTSAGSTPTGELWMRDLLGRTPVLLWLYGLVFIVQLLLYSIIVFVPQRLDELGVTQPLIISVYIAVINVAAGLIGLVYGRIRSRLSYRRIFLTGTALPVAAFAVLFLATQPWMLLVGTPLFGLGMALALAAIPVRIGETVPQQARGRAISYMSSMLLLGQFASPVLLGPLSAPFGNRGVFLAAATISTLAAGAITVSFPPDQESPTR